MRGIFTKPFHILAARLYIVAFGSPLLTEIPDGNKVSVVNENWPPYALNSPLEI